MLVVDDQPEVAELIGRILATDSHRVLLAADGPAAISLWQDHGQGVDLLITDLTMPGVSGHDLAARLRQGHPDLPVICTSGYQGASTTNSDNTTFLAKPFTPRDLLELVDRMLVRRPQRATASPAWQPLHMAVRVEEA